MNCESCGYRLEDNGRCKSCYGVDPQSLEQMKYERVFWSVCKIHGAYEAARDRMFRFSWVERDPKDKRRKLENHYWIWRCPVCEDWTTSEQAKPFKETIMRRPEIYQPEIEAKLKAWEDSLTPSRRGR